MPRVGYARKTVDAPTIPQVVEPDWSQLIDDLCRKGIPKKQIAERCSIERQVLYGMIAGTSIPKWRQGQLLIELHKAAGPHTPRSPSLLGATLCQM